MLPGQTGGSQVEGISEHYPEKIAQSKQVLETIYRRALQFPQRTNSAREESIKMGTKGYWCSSVEQHLTGMHKVLSSIPSHGGVGFWLFLFFWWYKGIEINFLKPSHP
jgi:hypothetical protein